MLAISCAAWLSNPLTAEIVGHEQRHPVGQRAVRDGHCKEEGKLPEGQRASKECLSLAAGDKVAPALRRAGDMGCGGSAR